MSAAVGRLLIYTLESQAMERHQHHEFNIDNSAILFQGTYSVPAHRYLRRDQPKGQSGKMLVWVDHGCERVSQLSFTVRQMFTS